MQILRTNQKLLRLNTVWFSEAAIKVLPFASMGNRQETPPRPVTRSAPGPAKDNPAMTYVEKYLKLADQALGQKRHSKKTTPEPKQEKAARTAKTSGC